MNKDIKYLVGSSKFDHSPFEPFSTKIVNFLDDFSKELNLIKNINEYPDLKSLAFWCRNKNISKLKKEFNKNKNRIGLGLVFHITPSNIPTNFAYSLIFGLITGNSNVVKVPTNNFEQINMVCKIFKKLLKKKYFFLKKKITIVKYQKDNIFTEKLSKICNARIIWGGDQTINNVRKYFIKERTKDISFADRYSLCILNAEKIKKLNNFELKNLVRRFYNDTYIVDQNACSSPHLILWTGKSIKIIKEKFWNTLFDLVKKKYKFSESASIEKYADLCRYSIDAKDIENIKKHENLIYRISLKNINQNNHNYRGKWGLFFEHNPKDINKIKKIINEKYQTLTYFGLNKVFLKNFVLENKLKGIDRIVPLGQSLDIGFIWDGHDILRELSRIIEIK